MKQIHKKQWFLNRIGKRIFRLTKTSCECNSCVNVYENGTIILDKQHAEYLFLCQNEMELEYSDKK